MPPITRFHDHACAMLHCYLKCHHKLEGRALVFFRTMFLCLWADQIEWDGNEDSSLFLAFLDEFEWP